MKACLQIIVFQYLSGLSHCRYNLQEQLDVYKLFSHDQRILLLFPGKQAPVQNEKELLDYKLDMCVYS